MKLNKNQIAVLEKVKAAGKATYDQAVSNGGNGRTVGALVEKKLLEIIQPSKKQPSVTYALTADAKAQLKQLSKSVARA